MTPTFHKICCHCKMAVPKEGFRKCKSRPDGLDATCKGCRKMAYQNGGREQHNMYRYKRVKNFPEKHKRMRLQEKLKRKYDLTLRQFDEMLEEQNGVCAICGGIELGGKRLSVDHNHETGKVRGLLCGRCNLRLWAIEDIDYVHRANLYLKATDGV